MAPPKWILFLYFILKRASAPKSFSRAPREKPGLEPVRSPTKQGPVLFRYLFVLVTS